MGETVKLIIEIPKPMYESVQNGTYCGTLYKELKNGTPLDDIDSDETRAYFDGQAYGWEEGRKALIDELKAEIQKLRLVGYADSHGKREIASKAVMDVLDNAGGE